MEKDIKIFVSHRIDKDCEIIDDPLYVNVNCGAVFEDKSKKGILGDNTGENISLKRNYYCEFTVMYWAWKNVKADYYGLCHYRRYLSFSPQKYNTDIYGNIWEKKINDEMINKYKLTDKKVVSDLLDKYDILISEEFNVNDDPQKFKSIYDQYGGISPNMHIEDLDVALDILKSEYPEWFDIANEYINSNMFVPDNLFIMRKDIFYEYCEWIFPILKKIDEKLDSEHRNKEELRAVGMIGERLFGIYLKILKRKNKDIKIGTLQRVIIEKPEKFEIPFPYFRENNIPIVFASSEYFVPYTGVTIYSLIKNASTKYNYDIVILSTDMSEKSLILLKNLIKDYSNINIRKIDVSDLIDLSKLDVKELTHVSRETYYRLMVSELFENYERLIYLDSDLIILDDISKIYNIEMDNKYVAATHDPDFIGEYKGANPKITKYVDEELKLNNPYDYFQAGVLVFNINNMKKNIKKYELINLAEEKDFIFVDQDILNLVCQDKVFFLEQRWNVLSDCARIRIDGIIVNAPIETYNNYMEARKNPAIIHYAGFEKPWDNPLSDFANIYWEYAKCTDFYEAILLRMSLNPALSQINAINNTKCIESSYSYKIGRMITWFPRKVRKIYKKCVKKMY